MLTTQEGRRSSSKGRKPRIGQQVSFSLGSDSVKGIVVEDRGPIGAKGRHLYRIEVEIDPGQNAVFELSDTDFSI